MAEDAPNTDQTVIDPAGNELHPYKGSEVALAERRQKVVNYRKAGASLRQIADKLEVSVATVHRDLQNALTELSQHELNDVRQLRALEASRLDDMFFATWPQAKAGVPIAMDFALRIMERRSKLYGLDAAIKVEVLMQEERQKLLDALAQHLPEEDYKRVLTVILMSAG